MSMGMEMGMGME